LDVVVAASLVPVVSVMAPPSRTVGVAAGTAHGQAELGPSLDVM
jgi:hypothetical protein